MSELLNCPFCGQTEPLDMAEIENLGVWIVECMAEHDGCGASSGMYTSREEMIAAWNRRPQPKLVLALPDFETRRIVQLHDEVIEGDRIVTCAIEPPQAQLTDDEIIKIAHEMRTHFMGYNNIDLLNFAKAIAASVGVDAQNREKACVNTNAESFRRAVDAMQKEKR